MADLDKFAERIIAELRAARLNAALLLAWLVVLRRAPQSFQCSLFPGPVPGLDMAAAVNARRCFRAIPKIRGDRTQCDYWRTRAIDGFLARAAGKCQRMPAGHGMGSFHHMDGMHQSAYAAYIIAAMTVVESFARCQCLCNRNEGDRPPVLLQSNNDTNWCLGKKARFTHSRNHWRYGAPLMRFATFSF
ncbi:MAG: methylamine dehydrogenase light chain [Sphingomonadaceae bacterium]